MFPFLLRPTNVCIAVVKNDGVIPVILFHLTSCITGNGSLSSDAFNSTTIPPPANTLYVVEPETAVILPPYNSPVYRLFFNLFNLIVPFKLPL
jgi:hypothetical protein